MPRKLLKTDEANLVFFLLQRPLHIQVFGQGASQLRWPASWLEDQPREDDDELYERMLLTLKEWETNLWYMRESTHKDAPLNQGFLTPLGKQYLAMRHGLEIPTQQEMFHMMDGQGRYR